MLAAFHYQSLAPLHHVLLFIQGDRNGFSVLGFLKQRATIVSFAHPLLRMILEALLQLETAPTISLVPQCAITAHKTKGEMLMFKLLPE